MTEPQTLLEQLNSFPPPVARLLCPWTEEIIALKSGLSISTIRRISNQRDWNKQLKVISAFLSASGIEVRVTIPALRRVKRMLNNKRGLSGVKHLRRHSQKAKAIKRIIKALQ